MTMDKKSVYKIKRTPMQQFIADKFRTYTDFAAAMGVTLPTARSYATNPMQMTVGTMTKLCVAADVTVVELFEVFKKTLEAKQ